MQTLTLKAPAKINLYLRVLGKRPDGFHNIETVFEKIDLCDEIKLSRRGQDIRVFCGHKDVPEDKRNLCYKAAEAIFLKTKSKTGVEIKITKKIPVASGLGGGSSDAANVLLGLNKLLSLSIPKSKLLKMAEKLGADVPFFILRESRAVGRGKGEKLTPLKVVRKNWYILVIPPFKITTSKMYRHPRITLTSPPGSAKIILRALEKGDLTCLNEHSYNTFEHILGKRYKEVLEIKKALKSSGASAALMSGSGPCVFGVAQTRKEAMAISRKVNAKNKNWQVRIARTYFNGKLMREE